MPCFGGGGVAATPPVPEGGAANGEQPPAPHASAPAAGSGGPAVFRGFQAPPAYAWRAKAPEGALDEPEAFSDGPQAEISLRASLAEATTELLRLEDSVQRLRAEKLQGFGVPMEEVERWCASVGARMQCIGDAVAAKTALFRSRMAEKDEVIKRLYWRLQWYERDGAAATPGRGTGSQARAVPSPPASPAGPAASREDLRDAQACAGTPFGTGASRSWGSPTPSRAANAGAIVANGAGDDRVLARSRRPAAEGGEPRTVQSPALPSPPQLRQQRAREGPERVQIAYLRQEVAQLRRQNTELGNQVRARESQVDSLAAMVREMQATAQRQLGLCRRQLHLRDDTLQAMQEELLLSRNAVTPSVGSASTGALASVERAVVAVTRGVGSRRTGDAVPVPALARPAGALGPQAPRSTRRPADGERGQSVTRSASAFARHKERLAATRGGNSATQVATGAPRLLSPRGRTASEAEQHARRASQGPSGRSMASAANRSTSAEAHNRMRGNAPASRRTLRAARA